MTETELVATNAQNLPMPPDEARLLADAAARHREKAARTTITIAPRADLEVTDRMERLRQKMVTNPIHVIAADPAIARAKLLLDEAKLPPRHKRRIPAADDPWRVAADKLIARLGSGFIVALTGIQGTGKTQLGSALIHTATDKLIPSRYAVAMDFFIALKETFDGGAKNSESKIISEFVKPKLLVLDECDERSESPWENRLLFHMLNQRYNQITDTLLISRRTESEFLQSLGESIQSRIQETGGNIHCDWGSWREPVST